MSDIHIVLDEQIRTATAVFAASNWPAIEQERKPHAVHPHTKQTRQFADAHRELPAVLFVNDCLAEGQSIDEIFTQLCRGEQQALLAEFATQSNIAAFWADHREVWETAVAEHLRTFA